MPKDWLLDGTKDEDSIAWMKRISCTSCGYELAPLLAGFGEYYSAFKWLKVAAVDSNRQDAIFYILGPIGRDAWPDDFHRDPRFHAFWALKGMPELAAVLRSNGMTVGLPLPLNLVEDQSDYAA